jgi:hypothetical protein
MNLFTQLSSPAEQRMRSMRWEGKGTQVTGSQQMLQASHRRCRLHTTHNRASTTTWVPFPSRLSAAWPGMTDEVCP